MGNKGLFISGLEHRLRGFLSWALPPDKFIKLYSRMRPWFLDMLSSCNPEAEVPKLEVKVNRLTFRNDLGNAAGLDKDGALLAFHYLLGAGFAVVGTVLSEPHDGNLIPAFGRHSNIWTPLPYSSSAINTLGLPSHGVDAVVQNIRDFRDMFEPVDFPIGASVMGHPKHDERQKLQGIMHCLDKLFPHVDFIEVNESCPNTSHSHADLELRLKSIANKRDEYCTRTCRYIPIFVKSADVGLNADYTIEFMEKCGVDGLILTNTQTKYDVLRPLVHKKDLALFDYYLELSAKYANNRKGGVSGPIIKEIAFAEVEKAARAIERKKSPLIIGHVGGLGSFADMERSRAISPVVKFREWYTGQMNMLGVVSADRLYRHVVLPPKQAPYTFQYIHNAK